jgi:hypothetical protein
MRTLTTLVVTVLIFAAGFFLMLCTTGKALAQGAGNALDFDSTDDFVDCGNDASFDITGAITIEAWVKKTSSSTKGIVSKRINPIESYDLATDNGNKPLMQIWIDGDYEVATSGIALVVDTWHHVAGTYDGSNVKIYVDGVLEGTTPASGNIDTSDVPVRIGWVWQAGWNWDGLIDEVRIWNVARTEPQIRADMCQRLTGSESGLVGYWRLDEGTGDTVYDATANDNDGTLGGGTEDYKPNWVWSGAAIGDESAYDYDPDSGYSVNLPHPDGDDITATTTSGTIDGLQVYRVDATSMRADATKPNVNWTMDPLRYWGVLVVGTSPQYTIIYNYDGHPSITEEGPDDLELAYRNDHADNSWDDLDATWDTEANTLTKTGQTGTEYALCSPTGDNSLPVKLSSFIATASTNSVTLNWRTETEVNNVGFGVYRSEEKDGNYTKIAFVSGAGNSAMPIDYQFTDKKVEVGKTYFYYLEDIDVAGEKSKSKIIKVVAPPATTMLIPKEFRLLQNYPNPFNPDTWFPYHLATDATVAIHIYNAQGQLIRTINLGNKNAGAYVTKDKAAYWNGRNSFDQKVASGVYFYTLQAGEFKATRKMTIMK